MKQRTKTEQVHTGLKSRILNGTLPAGDRLVISSIAMEFGTSDIPVREALRQLVAEGLAQATPHAGAVVAGVREEEVYEILVMEAALEGVITRVAAPYVTPDLTTQLEEILAQAEQAAERGDDLAYSDLNRRFHDAITSACPVGTLTRARAQLLERLELIKGGSLFSSVPGQKDRSLAEHRQLLALLLEHPQNLEKLEMLARNHKLQFVIRLAEHRGFAAGYLKWLVAVPSPEAQ